MPEILVISGKGGTGKTSLTGAFASLAKNAIICDLDVDAPDLHLLLQPVRVTDEKFYSGNEAVIDPEKCTDCGICGQKCRYGAVKPGKNGPVIDPMLCEGCMVCVHFCPSEAIDFPEKHCGHWYRSNTRFGPMVHAQLFPGEENSGRLVTLLRQEARKSAESSGFELVLSDGAPGIGCPVISSLSGTDLAVIVTEPTLSGRHDLARVVELCEHFRIEAVVIINKYDVNPEMADSIESFCSTLGIDVLAKLPFDRGVIQAIVEGRTITEYGRGELPDLIRSAWAEIIRRADLRRAA